MDTCCTQIEMQHYAKTMDNLRGQEGVTYQSASPPPKEGGTEVTSSSSRPVPGAQRAWPLLVGIRGIQFGDSQKAAQALMRDGVKESHGEWHCGPLCKATVKGFSQELTYRTKKAQVARECRLTAECSVGGQLEGAVH